MAGGTAAALAVMIANPLDCLRIRWQASEHTKGDTLYSFGRNIIKREGLWRGLWSRALCTNGISICCSSGTRMALYPIFREKLMSAGHTHDKKSWHMFGAGLCAGAVGYFASTPLYQAKTRIQAISGEMCPDGTYRDGPNKGKKPIFNGTIHFLSKVMREEGLKGWYRGAGPLIVRGATLTSGQFLGYDNAKTIATSYGVKDGPILHIGASVAAAFCAVTFSCPADVIMTRYMSAKDLGRPYKSVMDCISQEIKANGASLLYRGWTPFFIRIAPIMTFYMPLFEQIRVKVFGLGYFN